MTTAKEQVSSLLMLITDLHLSATNPASRIDNYEDALFDKLDQCLDIIKKMNIGAIVIMGDVFHLKSWSKNPYALTNRFIDWLKEVRDTGCLIVVSIGNHDVPFGNMNLAHKQPIGTVKALDFVHSELEFGSPKVRVKALDFKTDFTVADLKEKKGSEDYFVLCAHNCLMPKGQFFDEPTVNFGEVETEADVIAYGHIHHPTVIEQVNGIWFVNPGALSRGSISKDNIERNVCAIVMKFDDKIQYVKINLDIAPASEIFDLEKKKLEKVRDSEVSLFVDMLKSTTVKTNSTDPVEILKDKDVSDEVKELAKLYLDGDRISVEEI